MKNKKTARSRKNHNLSVVPIETRETIGTAARQFNLRAAMKAEIRKIRHRITQDSKRLARLSAAIRALGSMR